jgi:hypothetical protein
VNTRSSPPSPCRELNALRGIIAARNPQWAAEIDLLEYEIDKRLHYYGDHFSRPFAPAHGLAARSARRILKRAAAGSLDALRASRAPVGVREGAPVVSNAYFSIGERLRQGGVPVVEPFWASGRSARLVLRGAVSRTGREVADLVGGGSLSRLLSVDAWALVRRFTEELSVFLGASARALLVCNDQAFWERCAIRACQAAGVPTAVFLHGLPARYNARDDGRADRLFVWGDRLRALYTAAGHPPERVVAVGHPQYPFDGRAAPRPMSLANPLVLTNSIPGCFSSDPADRLFPPDREALLVFAERVKEALRACGCAGAWLRPHPSERASFYAPVLDGFYRLDTRPLGRSLDEASIVLGSPSTVMMEALYRGLNTVVYEPSIADASSIGYRIVPPFDGSDPGFLVARTTGELSDILRSGRTSSQQILQGYLGDRFDPETMLRELMRGVESRS